ncbi:MAG: uroporphyrinogen decarboxylase family protein [Candidatus Bathyarchaeota archaeon]|nr:uroporphyrinogen decarboxylase family protein [Candidatus Bathyarchaeota archaeon]
MCYDRGLSAIYLEESDRVAQIEYMMHTELISKLYGRDPFEAPSEALAKACEKLDTDMIFWTLQSWNPSDEAKEKGETFDIRTDWSTLFPTTWRPAFPVNSIEDVLEYDLEEHVSLDNDVFDDVVAYFEERHSKSQELYRTQVVPGGYYCTLFMWPVLTFGLEWTLKAMYHDPRRFERLLDKFAQISLRDFRAWAQCDIKVFISHDDICMTEGPMVSPRWLRQHIFPWYKRLWHELKSKGIRVLFCSDGNMTTIADDIADAGADGFIMEPSCDLQLITERYGDDKVLVGNVDLRVLTLGDEEAVSKEVVRCLETSGHCPGYFINVTGSIPDNVPLRNLECYFETFRKYRWRPLSRLP